VSIEPATPDFRPIQRFCSPVHLRFTPKAAAVASREDCPHARFALIIDRCRSLDIARHIDGS
jgi:hypothetical protein